MGAIYTNPYDDPQIKANEARGQAIQDDLKKMAEADFAQRQAMMEKNALVPIAWDEFKGAAEQGINYFVQWARTQADLSIRQEEFKLGLKDPSVGTQDITDSWNSFASDLKRDREDDGKSYETIGKVITWKGGEDPTVVLSKKEKEELKEV